jgi:hypothetical protein
MRQVRLIGALAGLCAAVSGNQVAAQTPTLADDATTTPVSGCAGVQTFVEFSDTARAVSGINWWEDGDEPGKIASRLRVHHDSSETKVIGLALECRTLRLR